MRFRAGIQNVHTFTKFTASLASLGNIAWLRLDEKDVRFTVIPETGSQVWSVLAIDTIFETYSIQSAAEGNTINLEVPLAPLQRALKSAAHATSASIRLTKKDNVPLLSLTIATQPINSSASNANGHPGYDRHSGEDADFLTARQERETLVTQDIPIRVLAPASVDGLHEPRSRLPDVHITLPNLMQLKGISDRFTKLAMSAKSTRGGFTKSMAGPKLEISANMHGCLRLTLNTDAMRINSLWTGLENPELDPSQVEDGVDGLANHPSTRMKALGDASGQSEEGWATVRVDGRDWGRVLSVGRLGGRVIACFADEHALVLYVFLDRDDPGGGEDVLTVGLSRPRKSVPFLTEATVLHLVLRAIIKSTCRCTNTHWWMIGQLLRAARLGRVLACWQGFLDGPRNVSHAHLHCSQRLLCKTTKVHSMTSNLTQSVIVQLPI
ncbi:Checkpoint protein hus1 [Cercospora beticola]|uniref:Checkpoint protein hus1 n=1 Tax=Cercospora beticola TaxID=122368 RepID=A0A2G5I530_CERBT|nr:Checkpoint protein hus1 [Cercospora beticola]PIA99907.1 Checkpoint protein hus1 [Cercospora beticola]